MAVNIMGLRWFRRMVLVIIPLELGSNVQYLPVSSCITTNRPHGISGLDLQISFDCDSTANDPIAIAKRKRERIVVE
jgi:hypothetical protein